MAMDQEILDSMEAMSKQKHVHSLLTLRLRHYPKRRCRSQEEKKIKNTAYPPHLLKHR